MSRSGIFQYVRVHRQVRSFARAVGGAAAIETALLLPVFGLLIGGIVETAMLLSSVRSLDNATEVASREIRIGNAATSATDFKRFICDHAAMIDCGGSVSVSVVSSPNLPQLQAALNAAKNTPGTFNPGLPEQYVAVEVNYTWKPLIPGLATLIGGRNGGAVFKSITAFRNEPKAS